MPREAAMLCAPLATRDGVLGVLKVAARHAGTFGTYEAELLQRFMPLAAVAIQNSQRTVTLEAKMLAAERKHAIADLARGISHDVNNALGLSCPWCNRCWPMSDPAGLTLVCWPKTCSRLSGRCRPAVGSLEGC